MANRTGKGGFQKGQSGNPGGRPKVVAEVRELAQEQTEKAISTLTTMRTFAGVLLWPKTKSLRYPMTAAAA